MININKEEWRYIYILEINNHSTKSNFYGMDKIYYAGQTNNIKRRFLEHLHGRNSAFLNKNFKWASKKLVFVKYVYGDEEKAISEEIRIKKMKREEKENLINSEENSLVSYVPLKAIVLKKNGNLDEEVCIKL